MKKLYLLIITFVCSTHLVFAVNEDDKEKNFNTYVTANNCLASDSPNDNALKDAWNHRDTLDGIIENLPDDASKPTFDNAVPLKNGYGKNRGWQPSVSSRIYQMAREKASANADLHVLDIGTGYGLDLLAVTENNPNVHATGIDMGSQHAYVFQEMTKDLDEDQKRKITFLEARFPDNASDIKDGTIDVAVISNTAMYYTDLQLATLLAILASKLTPDGVVLFNEISDCSGVYVVWNYPICGLSTLTYYLGHMLPRFVDRSPTSILGWPYHWINHFGIDQVKGIVKNIGFEPTEITYCGGLFKEETTARFSWLNILQNKTMVFAAFKKKEL